MKLLTGYSPAPLVSWAGWRYRIPGGPIGGQYHGFIAPDETADYAGWPAGPHEMIRPIDNRAGLGIYPWHPWDSSWHGSPLMEGQTVSDFVYRSPAELRPRPNASGGLNVVRAVQHARTAGFAVSPGNYAALGAVPIMSHLMPYPHAVAYAGGDGSGVRLPGSPPICPAWGCGPPPFTTSSGKLPPCPPSDPFGEYQACLDSLGSPCPPCTPLPVSPSPAPVVTQPPPPVSPQPAPVTPIGANGSSGCAPGQYRDAAGNCTSDWRNPYPMYLPLDNVASPAPTVPANTCPTGYSVDANGNCVPAGTCPAGDTVDPTTGACVAPGASAGITEWLGSSTSIAGMNIPNWGIAAVVGFLILRPRGRK